MMRKYTLWYEITVWLVLALLTGRAMAMQAQAGQAGAQSSPDAEQVVRAAVLSELRAAKGDSSLWKYRDEDDSGKHRQTYRAIETPQGELRLLVAVDGQPLSAGRAQRETERIRHFVQDAGERAKASRNSQHDDDQATQFLKMLPDAFVWTITGQTAQATTLRFVPDPAFRPPTLESRVLAVMAGTMVVVHEGDRIQSLRGKLTREVMFGYGLLGKLDAGGTFNVERDDVGGGHWEITQTHVHIAGRALLFKTIGQQEDEVKTEWRPSTDATLSAAALELGVQP